jgi:hypothetical protein
MESNELSNFHRILLRPLITQLFSRIDIFKEVSASIRSDTPRRTVIPEGQAYRTISQ